MNYQSELEAKLLYMVYQDIYINKSECDIFWVFNNAER